MKYFTPELYLRGQSTDNGVNREVDCLWEQAVEAYERPLQDIRGEMPDHIRRFNALVLHDAEVRIIASQEDKFLMVLRQDIPPRDLVFLTYELVAEPAIERSVLTREHSSQVMHFMYDEFDVVHEDRQNYFTQSILFSNGWEIALKFPDERVVMPEIASPPFSPRTAAFP